MKFDALLAALGEELGLPGLSVDANNECVLMMDTAEVFLTTVKGGEAVEIRTTVGTVDISDTLKLKALLEANCQWDYCGGAILSIGPKHDVMLQTQVLLESLSYETFKTRLEYFLAFARQTDKSLGAPVDGGMPTAAFP